MDKETGLIEEGKLNEVVVIETRRPNGTLRIQQNFKFCPTMAEQHTAHLTDINYLMKKFQPDELGAYIAARSAHRTEIIGHDFSQEPNLQEARNFTYQLKQSFDSLPDKIKREFKNHVEFYKFLDNPSNQEKLLELGLFTKKQMEKMTAPLNNDDSNDDKKEPSSKSSTKKDEAKNS